MASWYKVRPAMAFGKTTNLIPAPDQRSASPFVARAGRRHMEANTVARTAVANSVMDSPELISREIQGIAVKERIAGFVRHGHS